MSEDEVARLTRAQVVPFLRSVIASGERLSDHDMDAIVAALSGVPEGAAHVHDWHDRQQGAGRYCPGCDTMEWFGVPITVRDVAAAMGVNVSDIPVPSPEPLDVESVHRITCDRLVDHAAGSDTPYLWPCTKFAREYARLAAPQPVPENLVCGRDGCEFEVEMGEGRDLALHASDEDHQPWHPAPQPVPEDET